MSLMNFNTDSFRYGGVICLLLLLISCDRPSELEVSQLGDSPKSAALEIWWEKGFTLEEDEALRAVVEDWEEQSDYEIQLSFYTTDELAAKTQRAIQAGSPPDIVMSHAAERDLNRRLAWQGKLADVSEIIQPIANLYPQSVLETVYLYNNVEKKRSYYAVPVHQATIHISYWRDLVKLAGWRESDIPTDWEAFWEFWQQVQESLRTQHKLEIYGLGFPISSRAGDTYYLFEQILEAYDVQILDASGQLLVDRPQVRQGIIDSLDWYTKFYQQGYIPPEASNWLNPDNNRNLLNRIVVMTPNATLSIPAAVRQDPDTYQNKLGILEFPNKPSGKPMRYLVTVRQAVIFANSQHQEMAKEFLAHFIQPETIGNYLKASGGRNLPVLKPVWQDPFWSNPADPHVSTAVKVLTEGQTRPFYSALNPAYSLVQQENVWGKALESIVVDGVSPEQAADEAIARIEEIFAAWQ